MGKKVIRLTESQLSEIIRSAADMALNEIDGKTPSRVPNAATTAMDDIQRGISNKIVRADEMTPRAIQSFLAPYKNFILGTIYLLSTISQIKSRR